MFEKFLRHIFSTNKFADEFGNIIKITKFLGIKFKIKNPELTPYNNVYVKNPEVYLSVVAIAKNEGPYIKEWIEFHKVVGVERFYFYDNGSTDNTKEILQPYIDDGTVVYNYCKGKCLQNIVYEDAVYKYKDQTRWLAIIDLDEYIVPVEENNIPAFLKKYEKYPAVGINWLMFDSNGHKTRPTDNSGLITANYTRALTKNDVDVNTSIKSIVNPREVLAICNPHYAIYRDNQFAVTENYQKIKGPFTDFHSSEKIQINHYYCKSEEEYKMKTQRGNADSFKEREYRSDLLNFSEYINDYAIQRYLPELKERMGLIKEGA